MQQKSTLLTWRGLTMLALVLLNGLHVLAQSSSLRGTVTDEKGQPLPGVNVLIKGTLTGAITNASGQYTLTAPKPFVPTDRLIFSFVGFNSAETLVGANSVVNQQLLPTD